MGTISYSSSLIILIVGLIVVIEIFPANLCLPFSNICVFLEPLHYLKNTMNYLITVFMYFAILASLIIGIIKLLKFIKGNPIIKHVFMFLVTFEHEYYEKIRKQLA